MPCKIIQFIWTKHSSESSVEVKAHAVVVDLNQGDWEQVVRVSSWLGRRCKSIVTTLVETKALGGDYQELTPVLRALANQYRYTGFSETNKILLDHGIVRKESESALETDAELEAKVEPQLCLSCSTEPAVTNSDTIPLCAGCQALVTNPRGLQFEAEVEALQSSPITGNLEP